MSISSKWLKYIFRAGRAQLFLLRKLFSVKKISLLIVLASMALSSLWAQQQPDSLSTPRVTTGSPAAEPARPVLAATFQHCLQNHPYYNFFGQPQPVYMLEKSPGNDETLFYLLLGFVFFFALIKAGFGKYVNDLFTLFFKGTLRQHQLREQLLQSPLPSLLLNLLFLLSFSFYGALLARQQGWVPAIGFWRLWLYLLVILFLIYIGKFLVIKTLGWMLRITRATDIYLFVVFMANKMIGIFLLPILFMLAFPAPGWNQAVLVLSVFLLFLLLGYRFLLSFRLVRSEIKLNLFHFFIYICAFEIAPLLLIYKVLLTFAESI